MEIWFIAAVGGAVFAGLSNFLFKIAASRNYNAEVYILLGGLISTIVIGVVTFFLDSSLLQFSIFSAIMLFTGIMGSLVGVMKIYALRHIDATIFFPLFKLLSPALAILFGVIWFAESFSSTEWIGILFGLTVPLLLISKSENKRQNNLKAGLILVLVTALMSAVAAALSKLVMDGGIDVITGVFYSAFGIFLGTLFVIIYKRGLRYTLRHIQTDTSLDIILHSSLRSILINISLGLVLFAFSQDGTLAIVQTIHSMYILIPIVLSIIFYKEHWNTQKAVAIILSVGSLALLG
jgi:uncharacterized membrane protein